MSESEFQEYKDNEGCCTCCSDEEGKGEIHWIMVG